MLTEALKNALWRNLEEPLGDMTREQFQVLLGHDGLAACAQFFDDGEDGKLDGPELEGLLGYVMKKMAHKLQKRNEDKAFAFRLEKNLDVKKNTYVHLVGLWKDTVAKVFGIPNFLPKLSKNPEALKHLLNSLVYPVFLEDLKGKERRIFLQNRIATDSIVMVKLSDGFPIPTDLDFTSEQGNLLRMMGRMCPSRMRPCFRTEQVPRRLFAVDEEEEFGFAFTIAEVLEDDKKLFGMIVFIVDGLADMSSPEGHKKMMGIMDSALINAILAKGWQKVQLLFYGLLVVDMIFLGCLVKAALDARFKRLPSVAMLLILLLGTIGNKIWEYIETTDSTEDTFPRIRRSPWSYNERAVSLYQCLVLFVAVYGAMGHHMNWWWTEDDSYLYKNPFWCASLIGVKTHQIIIKLLVFRKFGEHVLPAFYAAFNRVTISFAAFIFLQVLNAFLVYFAIPVSIYDGQSGDEGFWPIQFENALMTFVEMFRLTIGGDADLGDLDGTNQYLTRDSAVKWEIQNAPEDKYHHHGVVFIYMFFTFFIGVIWLNIYIGLLSERYSDYYENRFNVFESFRVMYTYRTFKKLMVLQKQQQDEPRKEVAWLAYRTSRVNVAVPPGMQMVRSPSGTLAVSPEPPSVMVRSPS